MVPSESTPSSKPPSTKPGRVLPPSASLEEFRSDDKLHRWLALFAPLTLFSRANLLIYSNMSEKPPMTPEELVLAKKWAETWKTAGPLLEKIRRDEIRKLDTFKTISHLLGPVDFSREPFVPKPTSGLIEQQAWFKKFRR